MIDLRHPLAVLSTHMPWQEIEASLAGVIARKAKAGKKVEDIDLFGPVVQVSGGGSDHRLDRCYLKGQTGDAIYAVLCAAGYNIKWLMRMLLHAGIKPFLALFFAQASEALFERLKKIAV
jgi:hypothetical protein